MVTPIVAVVPHCPAKGVNVYIWVPIMEVFMIAGDQVPLMGGELFDIVGNTPGVVFWQYGPNCVKIGVGGAVTVTLIVAVVAHSPADGVKVYIWVPTVEVLMTAGNQVPVIGGELFDIVGNTPGVVFWQYGPNCVKVGVDGIPIDVPMHATQILPSQFSIVCISLIVHGLPSLQGWIVVAGARHPVPLQLMSWTVTVTVIVYS